MRCKPVLLVLGLALCTVSEATAQGFNFHYDPYGAGYAQGAWNIESFGTGWQVYSASYEPDTITPDSVIGVYRIILFQIDSIGQVQWVRKHIVPEHSIGLGWANCCDSVIGGGGISGGSIVDLEGVYKVHLMRYDPGGDTLWTRDFGDELHDWSGNSVQQTEDGGFLVTGFAVANGDADGFVIKTDSLGNEEWRQIYGEAGVADAILSSAVVKDGYVFGGYFGTYFRVQRVDSVGQVIWTKSWGPDQYNAPAYVELLGDSSILVASAWGYSQDVSSKAYYLAKLDLIDGAILWEHQYGNPGYGHFFTAAKELANSNLIACGVTYEGGHEQGVLLRTTAWGDSLWMRRYWYYDTLVPQGQGRFWDVMPTQDGGCIATGSSGSPFEAPVPNGISPDAWVVKVDSMGCIVPGCNGVGITEVITNLGDALRLYPNPVRDILNVAIDLPMGYTTHGPLWLTVTSYLGQVVLQEDLPPSLPEKGPGVEGVLDVSNLASGMYTIHLSDANIWIAGGKFVVE